GFYKQWPNATTAYRCLPTQTLIRFRPYAARHHNRVARLCNYHLTACSALTLSIIPRQHFQQLDFKNQVRIRCDMRADLPFAVGEVGRYEQFAYAADFHAHQAHVPALNYAACADHSLEGFAALVGGV